MRLAFLIVCVFSLAQATRGEDEPSSQREKILFFASSLTTTYMTVSTLASVVPYTCYASVVATGCTGKKKKKRSLMQLDENILERDLQLDTGLQLETSQLTEAHEKKIALADRSGKKFFTVWKTSYTTKTTTSYSTNRDITVSVLLPCTITGVETGDAPLC